MLTSYSATQQESRFFCRVACRLVFFHSSQKTQRRHTKTFCLAIVLRSYIELHINMYVLMTRIEVHVYIEIRDVSLFTQPPKS